MSKLIVVCGVTGAQGSSVAETFLSFPGWKVRGVTRNASSDAAKALADKGIEVISGDYDDTQSLIPAFEGANVIFSNTDFFIHLTKAIESSELARGRSPKAYGYEREVAQGVNIAEAASSPSVLKTLDRFIYSALGDASKLSGGKYKSVYHFDSKAETIRVIQSRFPQLAALMSTVQMGHYVVNWKYFPAMGPQKQPDGSFLMTRPTRAECQWPFVVTHRDTGSFVKALVELPSGTNLQGVSQTMTSPEWLKIWGDVLGVEVKFAQISGDEFFNGVPEAFKEEILDSFKYIDEFGYMGGDPEVKTLEELGIKVPLTSMEQYIQSEDWSSIVNA